MPPLIREAWPKAAAAGRPRLLFSAHGLPEAFIKKGDPYQWQIERTCAAVAEALEIEGLDWQICYQSRVGPQTWIGPFTEQEVERAGADGVPLVVCPIAFVSEHIETLVEMDDEYAALAARSGVPTYVRVPTLSARPEFIEALATLVRRHLAASSSAGLGGADLTRLCPARFGRCPCRLRADAAAAATAPRHERSRLVAEGAAHHGVHRLDGGLVVSAAAVRLPQPGRGRLGGIREVQGDGAPAVARHHHAGDDRGDRVRRRARHRAGPVVGRLAPAQDALVLGLAGVHGVLARYLKAFAADRRPASERFFRWLNELPTLLFVAIVLVVVFRPF